MLVVGMVAVMAVAQALVAQAQTDQQMLAVLEAVVYLIH
jgi:hypothetical protein